MPVRVTINLDHSAIHALASDPTSPVYVQTRRIGAAVAGVAKTLVKVDTGRLRQSIQVEMRPRPPRLTARVFTPVRYALPVHEGHGVIVPRRRKALSWRGPGGRRVFATRVRATRGNPFLTSAVRAVTGKTPTRRGGVVG